MDTVTKEREFSVMHNTIQWPIIKKESILREWLILCINISPYLSTLQSVIVKPRSLFEGIERI